MEPLFAAVLAFVYIVCAKPCIGIFWFFERVKPAESHDLESHDFFETKSRDLLQTSEVLRHHVIDINN